MNQWKLIVFDLDGTILNTLEDLTVSTNYALSAMGFPVHSMNEIRQYVGNGAHHLFRLALPADTDEETRQKALQIFNSHYSAHCLDHTLPYPGIPDIIQDLRDSGYFTAVVSNKPDYGVQSLCDRFFPGLFDLAVGQREGIRRKPYPDSVNETLEQLHVKKEEALYVGDSEVDIETAENAGIPCILVDWGFRSVETLVQAGAQRIVSSPEELLKEIKG